jgi:RimJ/RimL family protein N-acetyltransferase
MNIIAESKKKVFMKVIAETKRLVIREFEFNDLEDLYSLMSDRKVMRFSPFGVLDKKKTEKMLLEFMKSYRYKGFGRWALNDKEKGDFVGLCGVSIIELDGKEELAFGYRIRKEFWGNGLATEAGLVVKDYIFKKLKIKRVIALIANENRASLKVAEKLGMRFLKKSIFKRKEMNVYEWKRKM